MPTKSVEELLIKSPSDSQAESDNETSGLRKELARFDHMLAAIEDWRALQQLDEREARGEPLQGETGRNLRAILLERLGQNKIFRARARLADVLAILEGAEPEQRKVEEPGESESAPFSQRVETGEANVEAAGLEQAKEQDDAGAVNLHADSEVTAVDSPAPPGPDSEPRQGPNAFRVAVKIKAKPDVAAVSPPDETSIIEPAESAEPADHSGAADAADLAGAARAVETSSWRYEVERFETEILTPAQLEEEKPATQMPSQDALINQATAVALAASSGARQEEEPSPDAAPAPLPAPAPVTADDRLELIFGIDEVLAHRLRRQDDVGLSTLSRWSGDDVDAMSRKHDLGARIVSQGWIEQAAVLAAGRLTAYATRMEAGDYAVLVAPPPPPPPVLRPKAKAQMEPKAQTPPAAPPTAAPATQSGQSAPLSAVSQQPAREIVATDERGARNNKPELPGAAPPLAASMLTGVAAMSAAAFAAARLTGDTEDTASDIEIADTGAPINEPAKDAPAKDAPESQEQSASEQPRTDTNEKASADYTGDFLSRHERAADEMGAEPTTEADRKEQAKEGAKEELEEALKEEIKEETKESSAAAATSDKAAVTQEEGIGLDLSQPPPIPSASAASDEFDNLDDIEVSNDSQTPENSDIIEVPPSFELNDDRPVDGAEKVEPAGAAKVDDPPKGPEKADMSDFSAAVAAIRAASDAEHKPSPLPTSDQPPELPDPALSEPEAVQFDADSVEQSADNLLPHPVPPPVLGAGSDVADNTSAFAAPRRASIQDRSFGGVFDVGRRDDAPLHIPAQSADQDADPRAEAPAAASPKRQPLDDEAQVEIVACEPTALQLAAERVLASQDKGPPLPGKYVPEQGERERMAQAQAGYLTEADEASVVIVHRGAGDKEPDMPFYKQDEQSEREGTIRKFLKALTGD